MPHIFTSWSPNYFVSGHLEGIQILLSKTDGDSPVLTDATTNLPTISNMDLSGLSHDKNRPSFATSVSLSHSQQSSQQTQTKGTPVCKSIMNFNSLKNRNSVRSIYHL